MRDNQLSQLQSSLLFGSLSLIPNGTLRCTLLAIVFCIIVFSRIHLEHPSIQLAHVEDKINKAEEDLRNAKLYCAKDALILAAQGVRLLEVKRTMSMIKCHSLESGTLSWKKYRLLSRDIAACAKEVKKIRTVVQLIVESEHQRKYTQVINETETMLTGFKSPEVSPRISPMFIV
ncbi:hypothetical protein DFH07DRAFT_839372 [Mycena maculata]|uniref:Uncharacterized protein n=1 Tax=Mycena maculata TaxID=230809 RepID=A0AAD7N0H9_9AGAR|nr:hypothetical protein DFH07DRAFT_839372 [Mycena maculata]